MSSEEKKSDSVPGNPFDSLISKFLGALPVQVLDLGKLAAQPKEEASDTPQPYMASSGRADEFTPRPITVKAIQSLPDNAAAVMEFMWIHRVPFTYCGDHPHFGTLERNEDGKWSEYKMLEHGSWLVVEGAYGEEDFSHEVYDDSEFRKHFQGADRIADLLGEPGPNTPHWDKSDSAAGYAMGSNPSKDRDPLHVGKASPSQYIYTESGTSETENFDFQP